MREVVEMVRMAKFLRSRLLGGLLVVVATVQLTGCATIIDGTKQDIAITSAPSDATVTIQDEHGQTILSRKTPCTVSLKRGDGFFQGADYRVVVEKEGYAPFQGHVRSRLNAGWYLAGNFLFGGLVGWFIVDPLTGAMWKLDPEKVNAYLSKQASHCPQNELKPLIVSIVPKRREEHR